MRIVLLGTPGAGKGTQARRLGAEFKIPLLGTGDLLRESARCGSRLGMEARKYMDEGRLVPDDIMLGIIRDRLAESKYRDGFILDGFPRTIEQAEGLEEVLKEANARLDCVLYFEVDTAVAVERLTTRLICSNCGTTYNTKSNPPRTGGECDICGNQLEHRSDDEEESIRRRIEEFNRSTLPLKQYYAKEGLLRIVDAGQAIAQVFQTAKAYLMDIKDAAGSSAV